MWRALAIRPYVTVGCGRLAGYTLVCSAFTQGDVPAVVGEDINGSIRHTALIHRVSSPRFLVVSYMMWRAVYICLERFETGAGTVCDGCWTGLRRVPERFATGAGTV